MFCPQCGKKCPDDSRFCESCGSPIAPAAPPPTRPAPPAPRVPAPPPAYAVPGPQPFLQPAPVQKKSPAGLIAALVIFLLVVMAAAGGGAFYVLHTRSVNEADLSDNLMTYMWEYCQEDVLDYYDGALPTPYSQRGYNIEQKESSFRLQPSQDKNVFSVSGRVNIIDRSGSDASYRVDIAGTVTANFMRTKYTWDLDYDFEEPPAREPADKSSDTPGGESVSGQTPPQVAPEDTMPAPESSFASGYLWPTDSQYITSEDLDNFSRKEIMLMRNELYARYGCSFQDEEIRTYFESQSWYEPNPDLLAINFQRDWFNEYETANLDTIMNYERAMGWK